MRRLILASAAAACVLGPMVAGAETLVERDAQGRRTGTVERTSDGRAVLRDAQGRRTGTIERRGDDLIRRDAQGRRTGTVERQSGSRR